MSLREVFGGSVEGGKEKVASAFRIPPSAVPRSLASATESFKRTAPMIRRFVSILLAACFAALPAQAAPKKGASSPGVAEPFSVAEDGLPPRIGAKSYLVLDAATGRVLHEQNADQSRSVASTQKLITAMVIVEDGSLDEMVTVRKSDTLAEPSKLYLKAGETYPRYKLLEILLIKSANDVALCLARDNAGSVEAFAARMNAKARSLGMRDSHFVTPNGLPAPGQHSTARDMARAAMAAYRNRIIRNIVNTKSYTWRYNDGRVKTFTNTNKVLRNYALCNGMKTGYTEGAGHCLISSASFRGQDVIAVVLGDTKAVWNDSYRLLNWALSL